MAVNAFDIGSIPSALMRRIHEGLQTDEVAEAESICTLRADATTRNGTIPLLTSATLLARTENAGLAPLEAAKSHGGSMGTVKYEVKAYVGVDLVSDEERADMAYFSEDAIAIHMRQARRNANASIDQKLEEVLLSTTDNNIFNCLAAGDGNGAWNTASSTPLDDVQQASDTFAPDANTIVLGRSVYNALVRNDDIIAETSQFAGSGQLNYTALEALFRAKIPNLEHFFIFDKKINRAPLDAPGDSGAPNAPSVVFDRLFRNGFWLGMKEDILLIKPSGEGLEDQAEVTRKDEIRAHRIQYTRYIDIIRPFQEMGVTFTNVIA